jgi:hypothetical protein
MIVAATMGVVGFACIAIATQLFGYRLGGTVTVPVLAIYTLKNAIMLPVFVVSTVLAYIGLALVKRRTLIYGRTELISAILLGSAIPLVLLLALSAVVTDPFRDVVFIGSILPGLAAYNYQRIKPQYRRWDLLTTVGLFLALLALGWVLVTPALASVLGTITPPALYAETADIAVLKGATVPTDVQAVILPRATVVALFLVSMVLSERVRSRYGVRVGIVTVGLLAVYTLTGVWLLAIYMLALAIAYAAVTLVQRVTLLYGRVLIGTAAAIAVSVSVPLAIVFPITRGLSALFVGVLAGVNAYNLHVTPERIEFSSLPSSLGSLLRCCWSPADSGASCRGVFHKSSVSPKCSSVAS